MLFRNANLLHACTAGLWGMILTGTVHAAPMQAEREHGLNLTISPVLSGAAAERTAPVADGSGNAPLRLDLTRTLNASRQLRGELTRAEYDAAILAARGGRIDSAIAQLRHWHAVYPQDKRIVYDLAVLLDRSGDHAGALQFSQTILQADSPAYAVKAIAHAARVSGRAEQAETAYQMLLKKTPDDAEAHAGLAYTWLAQDRVQQAFDYVTGHLPPSAAQYKPSDVPLLVALAEINEQRKEWLSAADAYAQVLRFEPGFRYALRGRVFAFSNAGMPYLAQRLADAQPDEFSADEKFRLANAASAQTIRFGQAQLSADEGRTRNASTDIGLAENAKVAGRFGDRPVAQFDRIVALRNRGRMQEAVTLYEALRAANVAIPVYARFAAADAYLARQQPEQARDLYVEGLQESNAGNAADNFDVQVSLMYAYQDAEQQHKAKELVENLSARTPALLYPGIRGLETPNPAYSRVQLLKALLNLYNERLADAEKGLSDLRARAPFNTDIRSAWASLQLAREHPRAALDEFSLLLVDAPKSVDAATSRAEVLLSLNQFADAKSESVRLSTEHPDNSAVRKLAVKVGNYDSPYYRVETVIGRGGSAAGAESSVNAALYSAPLSNSLGDRYRVIGSLMRTSGKTRNGETEALTRVGLGADYRYRDLSAEAQLTSTPDTGSAGVVVAAGWEMSDAWQARAAYDSNVIDLPAAAIHDGVKADALRLGLGWTLNESRHISGDVSRSDFSDGNRRNAMHLSWKERWYANEKYRLDTATDFYTSSNSMAGRNYFNPSRDRDLSLTVKNEWLTWRRYQRSFRQRAFVTVGQYAQEGYASGAVADVHLEHEWSRDDMLDVQYGIGRSFHPYDGNREYRSYLYLTISGRIK